MWDFREEFIEEMAFDLNLKGWAGILLGVEREWHIFKSIENEYVLGTKGVCV